MFYPRPKSVFELPALAFPGQPPKNGPNRRSALENLNLSTTREAPPVPYDVLKQLELTFVEHKAASTESNAYTPAPRSANPIRNRLFKMATTDARRKKAASALLSQIEVWRLEYGRPYGEPRNPDPECKQSWPAAEDFAGDGGSQVVQENTEVLLPA